jgi:hypothetical protein
MTVGQHAVQVVRPHPPGAARGDAFAQGARLGQLGEEGCPATQALTGGVAVTHDDGIPTQT